MQIPQHANQVSALEAFHNTVPQCVSVGFSCHFSNVDCLITLQLTSGLKPTAYCIALPRDVQSLLAVSFARRGPKGQPTVQQHHRKMQAQ